MRFSTGATEMSNLLLHIAEKASWEAASDGAYRPALFETEGFVHCSEPEQVEAVANRLFRERTDLVLLLIDEERLAAPVRRENLEGGEERFPHVYGPIEREAPIRSMQPRRSWISTWLRSLCTTAIGAATK